MSVSIVINRYSGVRLAFPSWRVAGPPCQKEPLVRDLSYECEAASSDHRRVGAGQARVVKGTESIRPGYGMFAGRGGGRNGGALFVAAHWIHDARLDQEGERDHPTGM